MTKVTHRIAWIALVTVGVSLHAVNAPSRGWFSDATYDIGGPHDGWQRPREVFWRSSVLFAQAPSGSQTPALTDVDQLRIAVLKLQQQLQRAVIEADTCRGQLASYRTVVGPQELQQAIAALKQTIESAHPGYDLDLTTETLKPKPTADQ